MRRPLPSPRSSPSCWWPPAIALAGGIYQWKDANGVTHYSDIAAAQRHKQRNIYNPDPGHAAGREQGTVAENPPYHDPAPTSRC